MKHHLASTFSNRPIQVFFQLLTCLGKSVYTTAGLEITAGQRTISGLIVDLTGQTFVLPVMLTSQNSIVLKMK